jgi:ribonucleotide reductase beta subunit family protein with ferritin-like domain|tara:strand:- start:1349 stop:2323 length:975 start_codon:yes stop_codon:yes gene_type:complete
MSLLKTSETYKPFLYPWAVDLTKKHEEIHWVEDEAELSEDVQDWKTKLSDKEKVFITHVLRLFTQSDVQVGENYHELLIPKFKNNEVRNMLASFANREGVHQRAYALLNDTLGLPDEDFHAFLEYKEMADKIAFMKEGNSSSHMGLALSLAQSVFNEGMSVFASFVMLLNFQRFGKMKGMATIVEWSIRDETLHVQGNAKLFREFCEEHPRVVNDELKSKIYQMAENAVALEDKFIQLAFKGNEVQGLTKKEVRDYIRHIADRRLLQLGMKPSFKQKTNPLPWLDWVLNGASHDNFFEKRVTEYSANGMEGEDFGWDELEQEAS